MTNTLRRVGTGNNGIECVLVFCIIYLLQFCIHYQSLNFVGFLYFQLPPLNPRTRVPLDKSSPRSPPFLFAFTSAKKDAGFISFFSTWRWTPALLNPPPTIHWRVFFFKCEESEIQKRILGKQDSGEGKKTQDGPGHSHSEIWLKKEREGKKKLWTKGTERHKRRWIIQCSPLLDSFVILYNGRLENNQLIAWKRFPHFSPCQTLH